MIPPLEREGSHWDRRNVNDLGLLRLKLALFRPQIEQARTEKWLWVAGLAAVAVVATGVVIAKRRKKG